jgi:hypothetical protein
VRHVEEMRLLEVWVMGNVQTKVKWN